ncbi:GPP34 family phosphoprotein [Nocardia sp. NBC_01730]|uniref:GOLPH3/VPS74 family protein n=1 Tax=Nocardia sp. NBC_01730 TaxID=2975998 RepID=UPI002E0EF2CF|nr:GPP34 family phosphoprotein [Nocardia sp. NBC_01730]
MLTVAEEFLLLALDDDTGKKMVGGPRMGAALAGAAIVELTVEGALRLTEEGDPEHKPGRLVTTSRRPADPRLAELVGVADARKPKDAVGKVAGFGQWRSHARNLEDALLNDLVETGYLVEEKGKVLGLFPTTAWKSANPAAEAEILQRVRGVIIEGRDTDERTGALISILHAVDLLPKLLPDIDKRTVKQRGKEVSQGEWAGSAVHKAVQQVQAVTVAIIVSTTSATASM